MIIHFFHPGVLNGFHGLIGAVVGGNELRSDFSAGDGHFADSAQIGAGLGQNNGVACLVCDFLAHHGAVGVAVDEGVQAGGVGNDILRGPGLGRSVDTQMAQSNDVVRTGCISRVNGFLHIGIERAAVRTAGNAVDVIAVLILEIGGGGLGERLGGGDADDGNVGVTESEHLVAVQHVVPAHAVLFLVEVARQVGIICPFVRDLDTAVHAVVELVVAQSGGVITGGVHQLDDGLALVHGAVGSALGMVAGVQQQDVFPACRQVFFHCSDIGIGDAFASGVVDVSMDIVGIENHDVVRFCSSIRQCSRHQGEYQAQGQKKRQKPFHVFTSYIFRQSRILIISSYHISAFGSNPPMENQRKIYANKTVRIAFCHKI